MDLDFTFMSSLVWFLYFGVLSFCFYTYLCFICCFSEFSWSKSYSSGICATLDFYLTKGNKIAQTACGASAITISFCISENSFKNISDFQTHFPTKKLNKSSRRRCGSVMVWGHPAIIEKLQI